MNTNVQIAGINIIEMWKRNPRFHAPDHWPGLNGQYQLELSTLVIYIINIVSFVNGNHIIDENGNKIEFTVTYENLPNGYEYKEPIYINNDGHLDTEDRHLVIKDGVSSNHAISVQQMINNNEDIIKPLINTNIRQAMLQLDEDVKGYLHSSIKKKTILPKVDEKIDIAISLFANKLNKMHHKMT